MYIPTAIIVILIVLYFYNRNKISDEISSLRSDLRRQNNFNNDSGLDHYSDFEEKIPVIDKSIEYTFQESQDRQALGVSYKATMPEIRQAYISKVREYNKNPSSASYISDIAQSYKRLEKIEGLRKSKQDNLKE